MWPLILLGLGAGYYFYKKQQSGQSGTLAGPYHAAILNLPAAGTPQNAAIYTPPTSPVVQTSSGPSSGLPQFPFISSGPAVVHAPVDISPSTFMHAAITAPTYKLPNPDTGV